jgi:hypothetical protein
MVWRDLFDVGESDAPRTGSLQGAGVQRGVSSDSELGSIIKRRHCRLPWRRGRAIICRKGRRFSARGLGGRAQGSLLAGFDRCGSHCRRLLVARLSEGTQRREAQSLCCPAIQREQILGAVSRSMDKFRPASLDDHGEAGSGTWKQSEQRMQ